jgi:5'-nucleotidase
VPSAAVSLDTRKDPEFGFAAAFSRKIVRFMAESGLRRGIALNVNIPAVPAHEIAGISLVRQGTAMFEDRYERRSDPRGNVYYWLAAEKVIEDGGPDCDSAALRRNHITVTPIQYDLTCVRELQRLKASGPSITLDPDGE